VIKLKESAFQARIITRLKEMFPGCIIMKNDSGYIQGIPDLTILYNDKWAMLECKQSEKASRQPNQEYYINKASKMSFARFICPENEEEVLRDISQSFRSGREACPSGSEQT
jgi:hypothetical protein